MATKRKGLGSKVYCDPAGGTTYVAQGLTRSLKPPARVRAKIDNSVLEDTLAKNTGGIEEHSEFEFMQLWDPDDTNHEIMDTLFGSEAEAAWKIEYPTGVTDEFDGWVSDIDPETIEVGNMIGRMVKVQRTSDITRTAAA